MDDRISDDVARWAASGCMHLTGPATSAGLGPPGPLVGALDRVAERLREASAAVGDRVSIDPLSVLTARGAVAGLVRRGRISCGGATRLLRTTDGWVAIALARDNDIALVPALVGREVAEIADPWDAVEHWCAAESSAFVVERGVLLGLPLAALATPHSSPQGGSGDLRVPVRQVPHATTGVNGARARELVVVDLSSLWAGPLCGDLLARAGCTVMKVESLDRPDGARLGPRAFFDLLNGRKRSVALDFRASEGIAALRALLVNADVVIEASRPRALAHLGLDVEQLVATGPQVWVSITGHGYIGAESNRIAFGDDAAVAGGLVVHDASGPAFCADAIADPIAGMVAATTALECLARGGVWHVDVAMAPLAALVSGPTLRVPVGMVAAAPSQPLDASPAAGLGVDTAWALALART